MKYVMTKMIIFDVLNAKTNYLYHLDKLYLMSN